MTKRIRSIIGWFLISIPFTLVVALGTFPFGWPAVIASVLVFLAFWSLLIVGIEWATRP